VLYIASTLYMESLRQLNPRIFYKGKKIKDEIGILPDF
jgi:hypothetical protein